MSRIHDEAAPLSADLFEFEDEDGDTLTLSQERTHSYGDGGRVGTYLEVEETGDHGSGVSACVLLSDEGIDGLYAALGDLIASR